MKTLQILTLSLGIFSITACNTVKKPATDTNQAGGDYQTITDRKWKLIELEGKTVADSINGKQPFLLFQKSDSRYTGTGGCNGIGGTFTLADMGRIKFTQGMSTMMACENMEVENGLNKAMVIVDNYTVSNDTLSLNKARMAPLARFVALKD